MSVNWISAGSILRATPVSQRVFTSLQTEKTTSGSRAADPARVTDALTDLRSELQNALGTASPSSAAPRPIFVTRDRYEDQVVVGTQDFLIGFEKSEPVERSGIAREEIAAVASSLAALQTGLDTSPAQGGRAAGQISIELAGIVRGLDLNNLAARSSAAAIAKAMDQVDRALAQTELLQMKLQKQQQPTAIEPGSFGLDGLDDHLDPPQTVDAVLALARSVASRLRGIAGPVGLGSGARNSVFSTKL